jgi:hypothetical protein
VDPDDRNAFRASLDAIGEPQVIAKRKANAWGFGTARAQVADAWLAERELLRRTDALEAARKSAEAAETSARSAKLAERWALWAIAAAIISTAVTVAIFYYQR